MAIDSSLHRPVQLSTRQSVNDWNYRGYYSTWFIYIGDGHTVVLHAEKQNAWLLVVAYILSNWIGARHTR